MRIIIVSLIVATLAFLSSCANQAKSVEENGGTVITVKFFDLPKNGETPQLILDQLNARVKHLQSNGLVRYSALDSTYQISLPEFYSERNLRFLLSKGEINLSMLWHHSEFDKPHGKRLVAELSKKYQVDQQEMDFVIEGVTFSDIPEIAKYISDRKLLTGFPSGTKLFWKAPSPTGRENTVVLFLLSDSPDNFNLNAAVDSSKVTATESDRFEEYYTKLFLNAEYTSRYADISDRNVGNMIAISIDQYVVSTPVVDSRVDTGVVTSLANYDYEGHVIFEALLASTPIKSPSQIINYNIISNKKKEI